MLRPGKGFGATACAVHVQSQHPLPGPPVEDHNRAEAKAVVYKEPHVRARESLTDSYGHTN